MHWEKRFAEGHTGHLSVKDMNCIKERLKKIKKEKKTHKKLNNYGEKQSQCRAKMLRYHLRVPAPNICVELRRLLHWW